MNRFLTENRDLEEPAQDKPDLCGRHRRSEVRSLFPHDRRSQQPSPSQSQLLFSVLLLMVAGLGGFSLGRRFQHGLDRHKVEASRVSGTVTSDMMQVTYRTVKTFDAPVGEDVKEFRSLLPRLVSGLQQIERERNRRQTEAVRRKVATSLGLSKTATSHQLRTAIEESQKAGHSTNWPAIRSRVNFALGMESWKHPAKTADTVQDRAMWTAFNERFPPSQAETVRFYEITRQKLAQEFDLNKYASWRAIQIWIEQRENRQDPHAFNTIRTGLGFAPMPRSRIDPSAWRHLHSILTHNTPMKFSPAVVPH